MRTITKEVYHYTELSPEAQETAVSNMRDRIGNSRFGIACDDYRECLKEIERQFNINVRDWGVGLCSPVYFKFDIKDFEMNGVENGDSKYIIRYCENFIFPRLQYERKTYWHNGKTRKSRIQKKYECCLTGTYTDCTIDKILSERYEYVRKGYSLREFIVKCRKPIGL